MKNTRLDIFLDSSCFMCREKINFTISNNSRRGCVYSMSAVPQAAFAVCKVRQNANKNTPRNDGDKEFFKNFARVELSPLQYNSKLMNSVWGMYNRYSVHNLKKIMDDGFSLNQQIVSVGSNVGTACGRPASMDS